MSDFEKMEYPDETEKRKPRHQNSRWGFSRRYSIVLLAVIMLLAGLIIRISKSPQPSVSVVNVNTSTALKLGETAPNDTLTTIGGRMLTLT